MRRQYEYLLCQSQEGKITFVNNKYIGTFLGDQVVNEDRERMFDSCPAITVFLQDLGQQGWELVSAYCVVGEYGMFERLYFKRAKRKGWPWGWSW